ncbi:MAG: hypothetical protein KBA61_05340 [Spirochaetes bacterium]|nr:hypothetical protein [Spirochaetota bacterium]HPA71381.1 hypothetical protein [Spirochaetota bacterium]
MYCFIALLAVLFAGEPLFALSAHRIVAWPVPFNPNRQTLTINYEPGFTPTAIPNLVKVEIFDINGDLVYEGQAGGLPYSWSGRNMGGRMVHPGMYIIKLTVENTGTGAFGRRIIRIVVAR